MNPVPYFPCPMLVVCETSAPDGTNAPGGGTAGEDGVVLAFDLRNNGRGVPLLRQPGSRGISGMALNPADPNYIFVCGDSPFLECFDARKVDAPAAR